MQEQMVSLATMGNGAVIERADEEIQKVLSNIVDPNTDPTKVREVTIKLTIRPNEDRDVASVHIGVSSKLASATPVHTTMMIGCVGKLVAATERYNDKDVPAYQD